MHTAQQFLADGSVRRPSTAETLPFTLLPPEQGKVRLLATQEVRFCNLTNTVHGGWTTMMLDAAMSLAAQTTLSPGETCPPHETTAKFVRPISLDTGVTHVIGRVVSRGRNRHHAGGQHRGRPWQGPPAWHVDVPGREQEAVMSAFSAANPAPSE